MIIYTRVFLFMYSLVDHINYMGMHTQREEVASNIFLFSSCVVVMINLLVFILIIRLKNVTVVRRILYVVIMMAISFAITVVIFIACLSQLDPWI